MRFLVAGLFALTMLVQLTGCGRQVASTTAGRSNLSSSQPIGTGLKPASQVQACCRPLAEGQISLDRCMENPACKANNRMCCMQAIQ